MENVIKPELSKVFQWDLFIAGPHIVITINIPEGFDVQLVSANLNTSKNAISVRYPSQPPIIEGLLFVEVNDIEMKINNDEENFTISFSTNSQSYQIGRAHV